MVLCRNCGQVFYGDAFAALVLFTLAVVAFFALSGNASFSEARLLDALVSDAESISSSLMSAGMPPDWSPGNVSVIGLTDGSYRLNSTKVSTFLAMPVSTVTNLFGTNANYLVFFRDRDSNVLAFNDQCIYTNAGIGVSAITGNICANFTVSNASRLVASERLVFYNSQIVKLGVYVWN